MVHYNPEKMIPKEAVAPMTLTVLSRARLRVVERRPQTAAQKKTIKRHHNRKQRKYNKQICRFSA